MRKPIPVTELRKMILEIAETEYRFMSIREITLQLEERYGVRKSPQAVKNILRDLEKRGKLKRE